MCGICGFYGFRDDALLKRMSDLIQHRGPDHAGTFIADQISLAHRRLSIIDLSDKANQPMANEDKTLWLSFNGEIYNFKELRSNLEKKGHIFNSNTDSEVVLHAYEEKGLDCVEDFRGMFAFALWDQKKKRLILCRDKLGKKPLYYWWNGSVLAFASEIKALLTLSMVSKQINEDAFHLFVAFQYVPGEQTAIKNVFRVSPAEMLILENNRLTKKKYWDVLNLETQSNVITQNQAEQELERLLEESVKLRLVSDVPLGVLLSGGIDSSSLVALMRKNTTSSIKTFSVGFGEKSDELKYARVVSKAFNTEHREFIIKPNNLIESLNKIVWHLDEPIADGGAFATFLVSETVKDYVKVVLVGEGADELFGGYSWHQLASSYLNFIPKFVKEQIYFYLNTFYRGWSNNSEIYRQFKEIFNLKNKRINFLSQMSLLK